MEMEKSKVLIQFLLIFKQSGDVLSFLYARRLRGYTATVITFCLHPFLHLEHILSRHNHTMTQYKLLLTILHMIDEAHVLS